MRFYALSTGVVKHLLSAPDGRELDLPFEVTDEEREIILFPRSCFILGRSGTGKTTVSTMKLYWKMEQLGFVSDRFSPNLRSDGTVIHQIFITVSKTMLCRQRTCVSVEKYYTDNTFIDMDGIDEMAKFQDIRDTFVGIQTQTYPLTSLVYGEPPGVLDSGSDENALLTIFGGGENVDKKMVGFGAQKVILVRDDSAKREICNYIGHQALILTIAECQGPGDVLLYNFFGSSPLSRKWRVLYEFLREKELLDSSFPESYPNFSQLRHRVLCFELKQLYVAITRTRQRLWICENTEEFSKPMFDYWKTLCLVNVRKVDDSLAQAMKKASSPEEWKSQGIKLLGEKYYEMAITCFERAGEPTWEKRAKAAGLNVFVTWEEYEKADSMEVLFPRSNEISHGQITSVEENMIQSSGEVPSSSDDRGMTSVVPFLNMELKTDLNLSSENDEDSKIKTMTDYIEALQRRIDSLEIDPDWEDILDNMKRVAPESSSHESVDPSTQELLEEVLALFSSDTESSEDNCCSQNTKKRRKRRSEKIRWREVLHIEHLQTCGVFGSVQKIYPHFQASYMKILKALLLR
ncbi:uncharacterized protein Fot_35400 [Forsythia ovata]|uniref:Uncharacterized protein n=1 Tax=Forsythia ovata TaxID=205694 RepID=A0ABD1SLE9_9LAMI